MSGQLKRAFVLCIAAFFSAASLMAENYPALMPKNATSMALGGSFASISTAEFSFFGNPAAFASTTGSFDISSDAWAYVRPTIANLTALSQAFKSSSALSAVAGLMPLNGGIGGGASVGLGYAGKGLGLGAFAMTDEYAAGDSIPGATLQSDSEVSMVFGLGLPLNFFGKTLSIGGDFRPFYRIRAQAPLASVMTGLVKNGGSDFQSSVLDSVPVFAGFGLAMDLGANLQLGSLGIGVSLRDISPSFPLWTGTYQDFLDYLQKNGSLPVTSNTSELAVFEPNLSAGVSWKPRLLPGVVDPSLYLELQDPVSVVQNWAGIGSALQLLHVGAELRLLSFITLRGGLNRGWISAGAGLKLPFFKLDAAIFTEELGALPGDNPRSGLAVQAAFDF